MAIKHSIISFFGKPNVGKSTLFNAFQKNYYSIISYKPQTTRNIIATTLDFDQDHQSIIIDTPGFHIARNKLDEYLNKEITSVLKYVTTCCFIFDISRDFDIEDQQVLKKMFSYKSINNHILIINKIDKVDNLEQLKIKLFDNIKEYKFDDIIEISAMNNINLDKLLETLKKSCIYEDIDISFFKEPMDEFLVSEIIREEIIFLLKKELPYSTSIVINSFKYDQTKNCLDIEADIVVEKDSQKLIMVGKNGSMIKNIGTKARMKLLNIFDCKINLKLFVKVKKDWRNNEYFIKSMYRN